MERFIKVLGVANSKVTPDKVNIKIKQIKKDKSYQQAIKSYEADLEKIKHEAVTLGLDLSKLKSESYSIDCDRQWHDNQYVDKGYIVKGQYSYEMDIDYGFLHVLINKIASSDAKFMVTYEFFASNSKKIEEEMIKGAVLDATQKAKIIAKASKVKLLDIAKIDFNDNQASNYKLKDLALSETEVISAKDIDISKEIEITWNID